MGIAGGMVSAKIGDRSEKSLGVVVPVASVKCCSSHLISFKKSEAAEFIWVLSNVYGRFKNWCANVQTLVFEAPVVRARIGGKTSRTWVLAS